MVWRLFVKGMNSKLSDSEDVSSDNRNKVSFSLLNSCMFCSGSFLFKGAVDERRDVLLCEMGAVSFFVELVFPFHLNLHQMISICSMGTFSSSKCEIYC